MIAYKPEDVNEVGVQAQINQSKRDYFLAALAKRGIEHEKTIDESTAEKTYTRFIKLHATPKFLFRYAELMAINMPLCDEANIRKRLADELKDDDDDEEDDEDDESFKENDSMKTYLSKIKDWYSSCKKSFWSPFEIKDDNSGITAEESDYYTAVYREDRKQFFNIENEYDFFQDRDRIRMVAYALQEAKYGKKKDQIGIRRMVMEGAVENFYPLHDGFHRNKSSMQPDPPSYRMWLHENWAAFGNMFKIQPLDQIRNYFGEKVALYFAFMGFYTNWLIAFSLLGVAVMIFGLATYDDSTYVNELCSLNYTMCPRYTRFNHYCSY